MTTLVHYFPIQNRPQTAVCKSTAVTAVPIVQRHFLEFRHSAGSAIQPRRFPPALQGSFLTWSATSSAMLIRPLCAMSWTAVPGPPANTGVPYVGAQLQVSAEFCNANLKSSGCHTLLLFLGMQRKTTPPTHNAQRYEACLHLGATKVIACHVYRSPHTNRGRAFYLKDWDWVTHKQGINIFYIKPIHNSPTKISYIHSNNPVEVNISHHMMQSSKI